MDGGSNDGTLQILERYRDRLQFVSAPDDGAPDAINRGFRRSRGSIFNWIGSDDLYLPGAIRAAVERFNDAPHAGVVYGGGVWIDEEGKELGDYPVAQPFDAAMLARECPLCQPAAFMRREVFEAAGLLRPELHFTFDYDLWIRLSKICRFEYLSRPLAASRMHRANKTLGSRTAVFKENIELLRRHFGYVPLNWVYGYLTYLRDGRDQFFDKLEHSPWTYLMSLPAGLKYNYRHPWRYWREWSGKLSAGNLRQLRRTRSE